MIKELITAGNLLAETLEAENAALTVLDLPRAGAMLARKQRALADLAAAAQCAPASRDPAERVARQAAGACRWRTSACWNARSAAQGRVIGVVARAAAPAMAPTGYGAARQAGRPAALALLARA